MFTRLKNSERVTGAKQLIKALQADQVAVVYIAADADLFVTRPVRDACRAKNIPVVEVPSMKALGEACAIQVGAAVAGAKK